MDGLIALCADAFPGLSKPMGTQFHALVYDGAGGGVWDRFDVRALLDFYGTAGRRFRMCAAPQQAYLPDFG